MNFKVNIVLSFWDISGIPRETYLAYRERHIWHTERDISGIPRETREYHYW